MSFRSSKRKNPIVLGPWGGLGGNPWDDGVHSTVRQIIIIHSAAIESIKVEYDLKGKSVWSEKHGTGSDGGSKTDQVKLDYPQEILTSVSGYYGSVGTSVVIRSLRFQSNHSKYGPFGTEQGTPFSLPVSNGKIVGFHGRSSLFLDSIGFHLKQMDSPNPSNAPAALRSITTTYDRNGYGFAEGGAGYDMVLAVKERGDKYTVLTSSFPKEQYPNPSQDATLWNRMVSLPSQYSDNGTVTISTPARFGPWGGSGGTIFDDGIYTGVRQINLTRALGISSMKVLYDRNGQAIWGDKHGVSGGVRPEKIVFDFPSEILTHITGYFGSTMMMGPTVIRSLTFHTTKKSHGPFGDENGTFFSTCLTDGRIVGFHGREGWYVDSIGVQILEGKVLSQKFDRALADMSPSNMLAQAQKEIGDEVTYGVVKEPIPMGPGPWGGEGGRPWDDGVYTGVKQIYITRTDHIGSIQIEYDRSGQSIWSTRHGSGGQITHRIKLDYPHEVLSCVCGYYNSSIEEGPRVLRSITLISSRGKYGPFGEEIRTYFTSATTEGKIVGFHGRSGQYLDAIGVHMQHWLGERKPTSKYMISKYLF